MRTVVIIPARYGSTRFPGKPLVDIGGKTMIQRVYEQAKKANGIDEVVVATDDNRIAEEVTRFGGRVVMTLPSHQSGTDRCKEAGEFLQLTSSDIVINVQGDEPFIHPDQITQVAEKLRDPQVSIATLARQIIQSADVTDTTKVKVVFDAKKKALYFSRSPIPMPYEKGQPKLGWFTNTAFFAHVGIYGYKVSVLNQIAQLPPSDLELSESLEQLRWLQAGYSIHLDLTQHESVGIDTPADLERVKHLFETNNPSSYDSFDLTSGIYLENMQKVFPWKLTKEELLSYFPQANQTAENLFFDLKQVVIFGGCIFDVSIAMKKRNEDYEIYQFEVSLGSISSYSTNEPLPKEFLSLKNHLKSKIPIIHILETTGTTEASDQTEYVVKGGKILLYASGNGHSETIDFKMLIKSENHQWLIN